MYDALLLFALLSGLKEMVLLKRELNLALHFPFQISLSCVYELLLLDDDNILGFWGMQANQCWQSHVLDVGL
jgi:hypothetical protein